MKLFFSFLLSAFLFSSANAQSYFTVTGKVINSATQEPMKDASVFAQNTTFGTVTDESGNYKLQLPNGGYDLAVTFTGFQTESKRINSSDGSESMNFFLKEKEKEMLEVSVVASNEVADGLAKYGSFFMDEFIGKTANSKDCSIQNPEVLKFFFSKKRNRLKITAPEPLIIKNNALGYSIKYSIDSFTHEYNTEVSIYTGYPLFEEMQPLDEAQKLSWEAARRDAYKGSTLHFMRSVYNKTLKTENFEVQFLVRTNNKETAVKLKDFYGALNYQKGDSTQTVEIMPNQNNVAVLYSGEKPSPLFLKDNPAEPAGFQFSVLNFKPKEPIVIEQNGYFYDQNDLAISGYWTWDKVADQLPYNYSYLSE